MKNSNMFTDKELLFSFAVNAPEPKDEAINAELKKDHNANPYGDSYKPRRRSTQEVISFLKFEYAEYMLKEYKKRTE